MELTDIKGIGSARAEKLKSMGIFSPMDLLLRFPDSYIDTQAAPDLNSVTEGEHITVKAVVTQKAARRFIRRGLSITTLSVKASENTINLSWFNMPFAARQYEQGDIVYVSGTLKKFKGNFKISNPTVMRSSADDPSVIPIYKVAGIPSKTFSAAVKATLNEVTIEGFVPNYLREKYGMTTLDNAISRVHFPKSIDDAAIAADTITLENLAFLVSSYRLVKNNVRTVYYNNENKSKLDKFISGLPYSLTSGQLNAVYKAVERLNSNEKMNLLIQGDVGCGKTAVALCLMYYCYLSGYQSAILVPTEILARQHYDTMIKLLEPHGLKCELFTASLSAAQKSKAAFNIKQGIVACIVGTHALFNDEIEYYNLQLVITDEQQRFGVNQRARFESKAKQADAIVMSATPIPRTLAMALYGELDQIFIHSMPQNRAKVISRIVPESKINGMFNYIYNQALSGYQTYLICPRIEKDDTLNSVAELNERLQNTQLKPYLGVIHGKMKEKEKVAVMNDFKSGKIRVLISTTVIEVGVDVPNATTVVIFDADRYGLSELHQMRGRVGRGNIDSYCFITSNVSSAVNRLHSFCACVDGFELAELDFKLRGAGDFIGTNQHGGAKNINAEMIIKARDLSNDMLAVNSIAYSIKNSLKNEEFIKSITLN